MCPLYAAYRAFHSVAIGDDDDDGADKGDSDGEDAAGDGGDGSARLSDAVMEYFDGDGGVDSDAECPSFWTASSAAVGDAATDDDEVRHGVSIKGLPLRPICGLLAAEVARDIKHAAADMQATIQGLPVAQTNPDAARTLVTGRAVARVLHGIQSPLFPALDWKRHRYERHVFIHCGLRCCAMVQWSVRARCRLALGGAARPR